MDLTSNIINSTEDNLYEYEIETETDTLLKYKLPAIVHITCIAIILSLGMIGNTFVFRIYTRKPLTPGKMFLICFAILDLFVLFTVIPQIAFIYFYLYVPSVPLLFLALNYTLIMTYLGIMANMTIDRVWAVFHPFTYTNNWKRPFVVSSLCVLFGILTFICTQIGKILGISNDTPRRILLSLLVIITYVIIITSYTAILLKLRTQRRLNVAKHKPVGLKGNVATNERCAR